MPEIDASKNGCVICVERTHRRIERQSKKKRPLLERSPRRLSAGACRRIAIGVSLALTTPIRGCGTALFA